jgi:hypothetical protein
MKKFRLAKISGLSGIWFAGYGTLAWLVLSET